MYVLYRMHYIIILYSFGRLCNVYIHVVYRIISQMQLSQSYLCMMNRGEKNLQHFYPPKRRKVSSLNQLQPHQGRGERVKEILGRDAGDGGGQLKPRPVGLQPKLAGNRILLEVEPGLENHIIYSPQQ